MVLDSKVDHNQIIIRDMSLTQIDLRPAYKHKYQAQFSPEAWCVPELYWSFLKDYDIKKGKRINIIVSDNWGDKVFNFGTVVGFKEINMPFNFEKYFSLNEMGKRDLNKVFIITHGSKYSLYRKYEPYLNAMANSFRIYNRGDSN